MKMYKVIQPRTKEKFYLTHGLKHSFSNLIYDLFIDFDYRSFVVILVFPLTIAVYLDFAFEKKYFDSQEQIFNYYSNYQNRLHHYRIKRKRLKSFKNTPKKVVRIFHPSEVIPFIKE